MQAQLDQKIAEIFHYSRKSSRLKNNLNIRKQNKKKSKGE